MERKRNLFFGVRGLNPPSRPIRTRADLLAAMADGHTLELSSIGAESIVFVRRDCCGVNVGLYIVRLFDLPVVAGNYLNKKGANCD